LTEAVRQVELLLKEMKLLRDQASILKSLGESMEKRADWIEAGLVSVWEAIKAERGKEKR
jgi:hypothetical protein